MILDIRFLICKNRFFLVVFNTTCVGVHGPCFSAIMNARDKKVRGSRARKRERREEQKDKEGEGEEKEDDDDDDEERKRSR